MLSALTSGRPGEATSRPDLAALAAPLVVGSAAYLLARPLLALAHELLILAAARLLGGMASVGAAAALSGAMPFDPVYTATLFFLLAGVHVTGVAVSAPAGAALHSGLPGVFLDPSLVASGAWASAVIEPGASVLARGLTVLSADVLFLALGLSLVRVGRHGRFRLPGAAAWSRVPGWPVVAGALLQAHIVLNHLADSPISLADLEATGLTYGFSVLFTGPASERPRLTALLGSLPPPVRDGLLIVAAVVVAYSLALILLHGPGLVWRTVRRVARLKPHGGVAARRGPSRRSERILITRIGLAAFALSFALSPLGSFANADSRFLEHPAEPDLSVTNPPSVTLGPLEPPSATFSSQEPPAAAIMPPPQTSGEAAAAASPTETTAPARWPSDSST
jgi:hypothetical protein